MIDIPDGTACGHRACLSHKTYPCPFCGRIAGRALTTSERVAVELEKYLATDTQCLSNEDFFAQMVEVITPIVDGDAEEAFATGGYIMFPDLVDAMINTTEESKRGGGFAIGDLGHRIEGSSDGGFLMAGPWEKKLKRVNFLKVVWECIKAPLLFCHAVVKAIRKIYSNCITSEDVV